MSSAPSYFAFSRISSRSAMATPAPSINAATALTVRPTTTQGQRLRQCESDTGRGRRTYEDNQRWQQTKLGCDYDTGEHARAHVRPVAKLE